MNMNDTQAKVVSWGNQAFGPAHMIDKLVRAERLLEEAIEYAQAVGVEVAQVHKLADYVYRRPAGDPIQELGGIGVTAMCAAETQGCFFAEAIEVEVARVLAKSHEHFAARNKAKMDAGFTGGLKHVSEIKR